MRLLLDEGGADVNAIPEASNATWTKEDWGTALHAVASEVKAESNRFLLSRGAKISIQKGAGRTPKQMVEYSGHSECVTLLAKYQAYEDNHLQRR